MLNSFCYTVKCLPPPGAERADFCSGNDRAGKHFKRADLLARDAGRGLERSVHLGPGALKQKKRIYWREARGENKRQIYLPPRARRSDLVLKRCDNASL